MGIAYYPGCSLHALAREYDISTRLVSERLGLDLREVTDWNCCGATAAHSLDHKLAIGLSSRNLALVKDMKLDRVTTPCAGCFSRLKTASLELKDPGKKSSIQDLGIPCEGAGAVHVSHLLQTIVEEVGLDKIREEVVRPLQGFKLAAYYGCLITRPKAIAQFDDPEQPMSLDNLLQALGAEAVQWSHKAECCGGGFAASDTTIVIDLGGQVLEAAKQAGAQALVVACPMCQTNLDTRQKAIEKERGKKYELPIIYFTQLMGLAFGFSARQMGMRKLLVKPDQLLASHG
ncbi:MAG: CoB--CoM heterodisulfide reductase iron-sulfur subunit B family protein [Syntrophomonadaceae bacterium]